MQQDSARTQARLSTVESALQDTGTTREQLSSVETMLGEHVSAKRYVDGLYDRVEALQQQVTRLTNSAGNGPQARDSRNWSSERRVRADGSKPVTWRSTRSG